MGKKEFDIFGNEIIAKLNKGDYYEHLIKTNNEIRTSKGGYIADYNPDTVDSIVNNYKEEWLETHWTPKDWAEYYGCEVSELDEYMNV